MADLGRLLRGLRRRQARRVSEAALTYRELAGKTGWSRGIIGEYFAGHVLPPTDRLDELVRLLGAAPAEQGALATSLPSAGTPILGHAQLATYGQPTDLDGVQPIEVDGHHLVHNGNAITAYHDHPHAPSDTAALAIIYAAHRRAGATPAAALTRTAARIDSVWALAVLDADGSLLVSRNGLPLHVLHTPAGMYISSGELPGSQPIPEHDTWQLAIGHPKHDQVADWRDLDRCWPSKPPLTMTLDPAASC